MPLIPRLAPLAAQGAAVAMGQDRKHSGVPPMDTQRLQRKRGGVRLLATRQRARLELRARVEPHL